MGRQDEVRAAVRQMQGKIRVEQNSLFIRLKEVPLSQLTVGDLVAIVRCLTREYKIDHEMGGPEAGDVAMLEQIAKRVGR